MAGGSSTKVVQVTNIAPQATKDQMQALFGILGKIDEIRLYPSIRDVSVPVISRICYVKYTESSAVSAAQHMTNTVFIDRALICIPVQSIPDEYHALEMSANGTLVPGFGNYSSESKLPPEVVSRIEGQMPNQVIRTYDPKLEKYNLPEYPALPVNYDDRKIEETRRTILVLAVESDWRLNDLIDHFKRAGEVKYGRFAETDNRQKIAMVEFCEQKSVIYALKMQGSSFNGAPLNIHHSTQPIVKPEAKTNEAAQKEIEEAMSIVKECHQQISAVIDPAFGILASKDKTSGSRRSRTRSRSRSKTSHSRSKRSRSRKRSTSRTRRKRSTSRRKSKSRSRSRSKRRKRSVSRRKRSRSRSKDRRRRRDKRSRERSKSRHRDHRASRNRSKSRERRSVSKTRHRTDRKKRTHREKREERRYSVSRSRSKSPPKRSPSHEKPVSKISKKRSSERKLLKRVSEERVRDYDAEEKIGLDDNGCEKSSSKSDNMDISP
ncbi:hypothetical protein ACKWTF_015143 [Chironomus riparius]